ncbi:exodeoxyribonuclease VII small subunit [Isosphaera pallida]|nr:exodeoxyribonuclease VII small subunit [Isosphaera pallida]
MTNAPASPDDRPTRHARWRGFLVGSSRRRVMPDSSSPSPDLSRSASEAHPGFEVALERLEETVRLLESSTLSLDEALHRHAEGIQLVAHCLNLLDQAERRVHLLAGLDEQGQPRLEPFASGDEPRQE